MRLSKESEASFTRAVVGMARLFRWRVVHFDAGRGRSGKWITPFLGDKGFPDVLALRDGVTVAAELKVGRNEPTAEQQDWLEDFRRAGAQVFVWYPDDWPEIERVLHG